MTKIDAGDIYCFTECSDEISIQTAIQLKDFDHNRRITITQN